MTDKAYQNALKRREQLLSDLREVEAFLRLYERFSETEPEQKSQVHTEDVTPDAILQKEDGTTTLVQTKLHGIRSPSRKTVERLARKIMLERGEPMTRGDLVYAFNLTGHPIAGSDPSKNMGTMMWRLRDKFINIEGHGYWPKDAACEKVGYHPADSLDEALHVRVNLGNSSKQ